MFVKPVHIQYLKKSSKRLLKAMQHGDDGAAARCRAYHPDPPKDLTKAKLTDAQCVVAREHGFKSWPQLKQRVELKQRIEATPRHPQMQAATEAIDGGNMSKLVRLLDDAPDLIAARHELDGDLNYFTGATLLHYVAWNPTPETRSSGLSVPADAAMPSCMPEIARLLLDRGADPHALTFSGSSVLGLVLTGKKPSEAGLSEALIEVLSDAGAAFDQSEDPVGLALANHNPQAARLLIRRGHPSGLRDAAALGQIDRLPDYFDGDTLRSAAWGHFNDREISEPQLIGLSALYAYVASQHETFAWLLGKQGDWNVTGVNNGTLLHRAAGDGDVETVAKLVALGADVNNRDNPFHATPQDWADDANQGSTLTWMNQHTTDRMDIWQAARWGKPDRINAICDRDSDAVHAVQNIWHLREVTALRIAVMANQPEAIRSLLNHGAAPDHRAGDGVTPCEEADKIGSDEVRAAMQGK